MTVAPAVHQCSFFIALALEAAVYLRPDRAGLSGEELIAVGVASRYKRQTIEEALEWAVHSGQVAWRGDLLAFAHGYEPKFTNFMFGTFRPEYRSFAALDALVAHLTGRLVSGDTRGATRAELVKAGVAVGLQAHDVAVAFEVLRLGRGLVERDGRWIIAPERESLPLPSVVARWGRLLDQPRPEIERVYGSVRRVIGAANLSDTLKSDQESPESVRRRVMLVCGDDATGALVEQQVRRLGVEPVRVPLDDLESAEKLRSNVISAVVVVVADQVTHAAPPSALFQWGMLAGRFGRANVCALVTPGLRLPAALAGERQIPLDGDGAWAVALGAELGPPSVRGA